MRLNLGSGGEVAGYVSVDRKQGKEAYPLDFPDNFAEEVRASHLLEHFPRVEIEKVLKEWVRVLKSGGCLKIAVPDFDWIVAHKDSDPMAQAYLFGGQTDANDFHYCVFTKDLLSQLLTNAGLVNVQSWHDDVLDSHRLPVSLNLLGFKPAPAPTPYNMICNGCRSVGNLYCQHGYRDGVPLESDEKIKIVGVMSCPRLGWTDTFGSIQQSFMPLGIEVFRHSGVFWGQGLTKLMEKALSEGAEFIITIDYDSVFEQRHVHRLCQLMIENEQADVVVPLQARRENDYSMFTMRGTNGQGLRTNVPRSEFRQPLTKILSGHFGLTIIRSSSLKRLAKPWFLAIPDKNGEWNEGHVDEDIYFWHNCERSGLNVFLANEVRIGHLQNMIAWPDDNFAPQHQYVGQYHEKGQPKECGGNLEIEYLNN